MKRGLLLACFIIIYFISSGQNLRLLWTGGGAARNWNDSSNWLQINAAAGQTPLRRVPTEFDDVIFSRSQSGLSNIYLEFPGFDSLVIGKNISVGFRCRSMRVSNTNLQITNESYNQGYAMTVSIFTTNGGNLVVDSSSHIPFGYLYLNGGNPAVNDLEYKNSSFGVINAHNTDHCNILLNPNGRARLIASQLITIGLESLSNGGELYADNCDLSTSNFIMGSGSQVTLLNTEVHNNHHYPGLNFHIGRNSIFNSSNANVTSTQYLDFYTSGTILNGNVTSTSETTSSVFSQQDPAQPLPNIINGNLVFQGGVGNLGIKGDVKISGNFLNNAGQELIHPDTSMVFVNGQPIFKIGGINNYRNNTFISGCAQNLCHFKFELYGNGNSIVKWPVGIPLDTLIVNKTGCGKVFVDNSLYVSGQLKVQSGQLVLNPNEGIPYKLVSAGNVTVNNGAGIFLQRNAAGVAANIAIGGTLINNNTSSDSACFGISNPYGGTILSYNPNVNNIAVPVCVNGSESILSNVLGATYRWERNTGSGYTLIVNGQNYSGATTATLHLSNVPVTWDNYQFRCIVNGNIPSHTFVLDVVSSLPSSVNITSTSTVFCPNSGITFWAHPVNGGLTPTYQWQINGVNSGTNLPWFSPTTLAHNDQVKVILQSSLPCGTPASSTSNVISVTAPILVPNVTITSTATSVCAGSPITFTASSVNGGPTPFYQWRLNNIVVASGPTYTISSVTNSGVVKVIMISSHPCAMPTADTSNEITVTVSPANLIPSVIISTSSTIICLGSNVVFTATPVNGGTLPTYQWQVNGINAGTNSPTFSTSTLTNGDIVKVVMTSSSPCATPTTATSNSITVTVSNAIAPAVSISASATTVCSNSNVLFTATPVNGGAQPTFQWQVNGVNAGTNSPAFSTSALANGSVVKVVMTSSSTCANPAMATSNSITVTVSNQIVPSVSITASAQTVCNNTAVTFTATPVNGGLGPVYQWKKNGIDVGTNSTSFTTTSLMNADVITVVMISNASCASSAPVSSNAITMTVANAVTPAITISGILLVDQGGSTAIGSVISNGGTSPIYQWQDSTALHSWQNIGNQSSSVLNYTPASSGDRLRALLTSSATCANPTTVTSNELGFTVGRPSIPTERVATYPNPASSYLVVDSLSSIDEWNTLTVMSSGGRIYFSRSIVGQNKITVPISSLLPGLYMIRLSRNVGYPVYKKFIKL